MYQALLILAFSLIFNQINLSAQGMFAENQMKVLRIPRVTRPPKLSDFLDGVAREAELIVTDFRQYRPAALDGKPVSQDTTAFLSYDDKNLYVAFICKDNPKLIRARLAKHDQIMSDDRTMVNLDTFHDHRNMYWFNVNPYGVQADGATTDGKGSGMSWDTLWYSDGKITKDGYITMTVIPFKSVRFPSQKKQKWGLMLGRFITRNNEFSTWPYVSYRRPNFVQQAGDLEGLEGISPGRNIQLIPYGLFSRSRYLDTSLEAPPQIRTDSESRIGLDGKIVLRNSLTLDIALNPDFSQVESDQPQTTTNKRYEVFYPEKRPFFLENVNYFVTPQQMFFSRRIVDPSLGARLTGKIGNWTVGGIFADDRAPGASLNVTDPWRNRHSPVGVFRAEREFRSNSQNSSIGVMVTSQDFASTLNRVYSVDTRVQLLPNWIFTGQSMASNTRLAHGQRLAGPAHYAEWRHHGRHFTSSTRYTDRSPNFHSSLGFFRRVDIRELGHSTGYFWRPEGNIVQGFGPGITGSINYNRQGRLRDSAIRPNFRINMTRSTRLFLWVEKTSELFNNIEFKQHEGGVYFGSRWLKWFEVNGQLKGGTSINYRPGPDLSPFLGRGLQGKMGITLRPGPHLRIEKNYIYSGLRTYDGSGLSGVARGSVVFDNHIVRSNVKYQFNRHLSLRLIADYNAVLTNSSLLSTEEEKRIGLDTLLTYMLNPSTALYFGYTDLYDNLKLDPSTNPALQRTLFPDFNTGRKVFVKLSYLFRF